MAALAANTRETEWTTCSGLWGERKSSYSDQPPVLAVLRSMLVPLLQTHFGPIPTCLLFLHFWSLSGPSPHWHHLYDDYTV